MMSISASSSTGQQDTIPKISIRNVRTANEIYRYQTDQLALYRQIVKKQDDEIMSLSLAYDQCAADWQTCDDMRMNLRLQMQEQKAIIRKQSVMVKLMAGIAATSLGYVIYRELK
jgi:hypothetical protein